MTANGPDHLPDATPTPGAGGPVAVRLVQTLERAGALDQLSAPIGWLSRVAELPGLRGALTGTALGHAVHPAMTDVPIGLWSSSLLLDVLGREEDRPASRRLLAAGLVSAVPTVLTGVAEWRGTAKPETRIASAHAALNLVAVALYAGSLATRRRAHGRSVGLSFAATSVATVAGLLGGHLSAARKTGSRHPSFASDGVGPRLSRG